MRNATLDASAWGLWLSRTGKGSRHFLAHVPAALRSLRNLIADIDLLESLGAALACLPENGCSN